MVNKFIIKIYRFIKSNLYVNNIIFLYYHKYFINQISPANIRMVTYKNVTDVLNFKGKRYLKKYRKFLDAGDKGYFGYLNGKCAHCSWVQFGEKEISLSLSLKKKIKEDEAYIHYCETASCARGKNIYPAVLTRIVDDIKDKYKNIYISTNSKNISSQKGIIKAGFVEIDRIKIMIILGIKFKNLLN